MAIYGYECGACSNLWEEMKKISERDDDTYCPRCGDIAIREEVPGKISFIINGPGVYKPGHDVGGEKKNGK